jgi:hypothetical protein
MIYLQRLHVSSSELGMRKRIRQSLNRHYSPAGNPTDAGPSILFDTAPVTTCVPYTVRLG